MDFVLNTYNRNIPDEDLLNDLLQVFRECQNTAFTRTYYRKHGKYSANTIERRFGTWNNALKRIGLPINHGGGGVKRHETCMSDDDFFADMQKIAKRLNKSYITTGEYDCYGKYDKSAMIRKYSSWDIILQKANLSSTPYRLGKNKQITDEELFQDIERVWIKLGRQPTIQDIHKGEFNFGQNTFVRRFGGWRNALEAFIQYINSADDSSNKIEDDGKNTGKENPPHKTALVQESTATKKEHKTTRDINLRLRFKVMARDNFKCQICGRSPATDPKITLHIDHIIPWSKGGETIFENLQTLCSECNLGKSDLIL